MIEEMEVRLFEHENFVWLDHGAVVEALNHRRPASCDPMVVYNNLLRWSLYQLDRNACVEIDEKTGNDIPIQERLNWIRRSVYVLCHSGASIVSSIWTATSRLFKASM